jgi:hypothetical protein
MLDLTRLKIGAFPRVEVADYALSYASKSVCRRSFTSVATMCRKDLLFVFDVSTSMRPHLERIASAGFLGSTVRGKR